MRQVAQDLRLALELALRFRRGVQVFFQSAPAFQVEVPGFVDRAKTALSEQSLDTVTVTQDLSLCKRQRSPPGGSVLGKKTWIV
jgi:hypothetical protein